MSRSRSSLLAALAVVLPLLVGPPALASGSRVVGPVPVAGPSETADPYAARLYAAASVRMVCLGADPDDIEIPTDAGSSSGLGGLCETVEREDLDLPLHLSLGGDAGGWVSGAVRAGVATVEVVLAGGKTLRLPTVAAPASFAGTAVEDLRFYFAASAPAGVVTWRLLDAQGGVVHEEDAATGWAEGQLLHRPVRVGAGRDGTLTWTIDAEIRNQLAPLLGAPARRERQVCLNVGGSVSDTEGGEAALCAPLDLDRPVATADTQCGQARARHFVLAVAPAGAVPRTMVTGDGRRHPLKVLALPAGLEAPGIRVVVGAAAPGTAVRRLEGGATTEVHAPPPGLISCAGWAFGEDEPVMQQPPLGGDAVLRPAGAEGPRLFVRDRGEELCVAAERPVRARDCREPLPWLIYAHTAVAAGGRMVVGAVDARVRQVRLRLSSGAVLLVPTTPAAGYGGRYAKAVAVFAVTAPAGARVLAAAPVTPGDTRYPFHGVSEARLSGPAVVKGTVRVGDQRLRVVVARQEDGKTCTALVAGAAPAVGAVCPKSARLSLVPLVTASCAGPSLTIGGRFEGAGRRLEAVLADGRVVGAPIVPTAKGEGVGFVTLPSRAALRRVVVRGRGGSVLSRHPAAAPPANRQCGYWTPLPDEVREIRVVRTSS